MLRGRGNFFTLINVGTVSIVISMDKKKGSLDKIGNFQIMTYNMKTTFKLFHTIKG